MTELICSFEHKTGLFCDFQRFVTLLPFDEGCSAMECQIGSRQSR